MRSIPLVGLPADRKTIGLHPYQTVGEKYIRAAVDGANAIPILIPSLDPPIDLRVMLSALDGLMLTGAHSNIEPHHYGDELSYEGNLHDPARDANTLNIVRLAIEMRLPVLAVCRGLQEVNVALGGSLHQKVHETPGFNDHREDATAPLDVQYGLAHAIHLTDGGILHGITGTHSVMVNSLHGQGINKLAPGCVVEARSPDGLIEAIRLDAPDPFLLAVQWHPEWKVRENAFYLGIFQAFATACRERAAKRS